MTAPLVVELEAREIDWAYAPGRSVRGFAFNGEVPGPVIEAEVGDTIQARLTNNLPQSTTIHWHGLRVPADMDGTEAVQPPVEPGGRFEYRFVLPDAGTFWYHAHVNETEQLERGLYGALIVAARASRRWTPSEFSTSTISNLAPMVIWLRSATSTSCTLGAKATCGS